MKSATDIFSYMVDQPGACIDSSLFVTSDKPLDAKQVVSSWYPEDRKVVDEELIYEGLIVYSVEEKIGYICISKPETAQNANDCVWDVYYGGENEWLDVVAYEPLN